MSKKDSLQRQLDSMIREKTWGRYVYSGVEAEGLEGVPLAVGRKWVLVALTVDFHFDGFGLLRLNRIRKIKGTKTFRARIL